MTDQGQWDGFEKSGSVTSIEKSVVKYKPKNIRLFERSHKIIAALI